MKNSSFDQTNVKDGHLIAVEKMPKSNYMFCLVTSTINQSMSFSGEDNVERLVVVEGPNTDVLKLKNIYTFF